MIADGRLQSSTERLRKSSNGRGSANRNSKLTEEKVLEIRRKYQPRVYTRRMLADEYDVSLSTIDAALSGQNWAWLKGGDDRSDLFTSPQ